MAFHMPWAKHITAQGKSSCHSSSSSLSSNSHFGGWCCSLCDTKLIYFAAPTSATSCSPLFDQGVPHCGWLSLGRLWVDFRLIWGLLMKTATYSKHKPHSSAGFPCRVQLRHWAWLSSPSPCVFLLTKRNFLGAALLPDFTFLSLVLAGWGQRQKEIFELTGVQSTAAAGMTSACICLL